MFSQPFYAPFPNIFFPFIRKRFSLNPTAFVRKMTTMIIKKFKIINSIIISLMILMMDNLFRIKVSAYVFLHNKTVFKNITIFCAIGVARFINCQITILSNYFTTFIVEWFHSFHRRPITSVGTVFCWGSSLSSKNFITNNAVVFHNGIVSICRPIVNKEEE